MKIIDKSLILVILSLLCNALYAAPIAPFDIVVKQPENELPGGKSFNIHPKGDEWSNWYETDEGYSVIKDEQTGTWHYGTLDVDKKMRPSGNVVGKDNPKALGIKQHIRPLPNKLFLQNSLPITDKPIGITAIQQAVTAPLTGNVPTLFILVQFTNKLGTYTPADFAGLLTNQLQAYFNEASYGRFSTSPATEIHGTVNDGVVGWLSLNRTHPNTAGATSTANQQLALDAIVAADPYVDFAAYDTNLDSYIDSKELAVVVIPAGYETAFGGAACAPSPSVWGHQWAIQSPLTAPVVDGKIVGNYHNGQGGYAQFGEIQGYTAACNPTSAASAVPHQATMGIMAHELGHLILKLPDLYDTTSVSAGIGNFSLMAAGSWALKTTDAYQGQSPVHPDAWCKLYTGWVDPIINTIGSVTLSAAGAATTNATNAVYMQTTSDPNQYFLFENRGQYGFDAGLSRMMSSFTGVSGTPGGIAIWHIDESMRTPATLFRPNDNPSHKFIDLEEADNVSTMDTNANRGQANDLYFLGNKTVFDNLSSPNSKLYNGVSTGISLNSISAPAQNMTAYFGTAPVAQTITFSSAPTALAVSESGALVATATSGLAVTFTSTTPTLCSVSGAIVTAIAEGACIVAADQAGSPAFNPAPTVTSTITVTPAKTAQTITFSSAPTALAVPEFGSLVATASSGLSVTFTSNTPTICTVSGSTVTSVAGGSCIVAADQAGDATYAAAPQVTQTIAVTAAQTITFSSAPASLIAPATGTLVASASSGLPVSFTSTTPAVCTVSGATVTSVAAGSCVVAADQAGNAFFTAAPQVTQTITVTTAQTITFSSAPTALIVPATGTLVASASSGLPVTFTTTTPAVCSVSGSTVTSVAAGSCIVAADQVGDATFAAAPQVRATIAVTVPKTAQTITFSSAPATLVVAGTGTLVATASSTLPVTFTSTTTAICTVTGSTVRAVAVGTCIVAANQAGNATFEAATQVTKTITVTAPVKTAQTITFTTAPATLAINRSSRLAATATSRLAVTFSSLTTSVCTVSASNVTRRTVGACVVAANQAGNATFAAAPQVTRTIN